MARGLFITFEGGEGTGKSTQARLLAARLTAAARAVLLTREPGGTPVGEAIRRVLMEHTSDRLTELMLFAAQRAEHVESVIRPHLAREDAVVVCDRFADSTRVYQGRIGGAPADTVAALELLSTGGLVPDLTFVLDLPAEVGRDRALTRGDANRFDNAALSFHRDVREGFLDIARAAPSRCVVIDAAPPAAEIADRIWQIAVDRLDAGSTA